MFIARIRQAIIIQLEDDMGGYDKTVMMGDVVHIETKKGNSITGILKRFEESEDELMQDVLVIETQDEHLPTKKIGVNSIVSLEVAKCQVGG